MAIIAARLGVRHRLRWERALVWTVRSWFWHPLGAEVGRPCTGHVHSLLGYVFRATTKTLSFRAPQANGIRAELHMFACVGHDLSVEMLAPGLPFLDEATGIAEEHCARGCGYLEGIATGDRWNAHRPVQHLDGKLRPIAHLRRRQSPMKVGSPSNARCRGWIPSAFSGRNVRHGRVEVAGEVADKLADGEVARRILSFARTPLARPVLARTIQIQSLAAQGALVVYGVALVDRAGQVHQLFGRQKTKYRQVLRDQNVSVLENTAAYPRALLVSRARLAPAGGSLEQMDRQHFTPSQEVILGAETLSVSLNPSTLRALGRASPAPPGTAPIERYTAVEMALQVETPAPTFLVVSDAFYPGRHAYLDGDERPILRGDLIFRVVEVPAGSHRVVFRFEPTSVSVGLAISLGTVALFLSTLVADRRTFAVAGRPRLCLSLGAR